MNRMDRNLARLFKAAAQAPARPIEPMPWANATRLLAAYRRLRSETPDDGVRQLLHRGLAAACLAMTVALCIVLAQERRAADVEIATANAAVNLALMR